MKLKTQIFMLCLMGCSLLLGCSGNNTGPSKNALTASRWVEASLTKEGSLKNIEELLADDGVIQNGRYVGFGFTFNPFDENGKMIVTQVIPGSPAENTLQVGDEFTSVNGMEVNEANADKLSFRGQPGQAVPAVILRDGQEMAIEIVRGIVDSEAPKARVLATMNDADARWWTDSEIDIIETSESNNIVYVLYHTKGNDFTNNLPYDAYTVTRFMFNDAGKVTWVGSLSEDRLVLEQTGYSITR
jgi:hypothetical protein